MYEETQDKDIRSKFESLHKSHKSRISRPSKEELISSLQYACQTFTNCYFVFDGLDEYLDRYRDAAIDELLDVVLSLGNNVRLFISSRILGQMEDIFRRRQALRKEIHADEDDMKTYVRNQIADACFTFDILEKLSHKITENVVKVAKGR